MYLRSKVMWSKNGCKKFLKDIAIGSNSRENTDLIDPVSNNENHVLEKKFVGWYAFKLGKRIYLRRGVGLNKKAILLQKYIWQFRNENKKSNYLFLLKNREFNIPHHALSSFYYLYIYIYTCISYFKIFVVISKDETTYDIRIASFTVRILTVYIAKFMKEKFIGSQ